MINSFFSLLQKKNNNPFNTKEVLSSKKMLDLLIVELKLIVEKIKYIWKLEYTKVAQL